MYGSRVVVVFFIFLALALMITSTSFFSPKQATFETNLYEEVQSDPAIKRHIRITTLYGAVSHVEIPKTNDHQVNDFFNDFVLAHQEAYFTITQHPTNRLKQEGQSSHRFLFDWHVVDEKIASVVFYEHWSVKNVTYRFTMESFLVDFSTSTVYSSKNLLDNQSIKSIGFQNKLEQAIHKQRLFYGQEDTRKKTINQFIKNGVFIIERDTLRIQGTNSNLKNNDGGLTSIAIPFRNASAIMTPTLMKLLPIRENQNKQLAFTFDDGPNRHTKEILNVLMKHDAKATFFVLGMQVEMFPSLAKRIVEDGHEIANHSYSHKDLVKVSAQVAKSEINKTTKIIKETTGVTVTLLRPPYGRYNKKVKTYSDLRITLWNVDPLDWSSRDPKAITRNILHDAKDGSIILMHDIYATSAQALDDALTLLNEQGYEFVSVSELLNQE